MGNVNTTQTSLEAPYTASSASRVPGPRQVALLAPIASNITKGFQSTQAALLVVYAPPETRQVDTGQIAALTVYSSTVSKSPDASAVSMMAVYGKFTAVENRSRAWTFSLDGHTFYVLDLGEEGTFLYDIITGKWSQFQTAGFVGWNMRNGATFGAARIAGADVSSGEIWELDPDALRDEGFRDVDHTVTAGVQTRSRVFMSCDAVRLTASVGTLTEPDGATITLKFSDDQGNTWSDPYTVTLTEKDFTGEIAWTSLGSFMAPGRIFQVSDVGGVVRIDGADVFVDGYDG